MECLPGKVRGGPAAGYLAILGGFLLHLTLGTLYCFGNMNTYMTSYLRTHVPGQVDRNNLSELCVENRFLGAQALF